MGAPVLGEFIKRGAGVGFDHKEFARGEGGPQIGEGVLDGGAGVAVARQVSEVDASPARVGDAGEELAGGLIGKMTVAAGDTLLDGPRAFGIGLQELGAVV